MKKPHDSKFRSRVALEALRGELTIAELAEKYQLHPTRGGEWLLAKCVFCTGLESRKAQVEAGVPGLSIT